MKKLLAMMILLLCALPLYSQGHNTQSIYYVNTQDTSTGNALNIWKNVQAKPFNAIANGSTDNRAAIQATFTAAGSNSTVIFPPGNYHTSDSILIAGSNVTVDGPGATIQQTTAGKKIFKVTGSGVTFRNITIVGDTIAGSYDQNNKYDVGIDYAYGTSNQLIEHCDISLLKVGVWGFKVDGLTVRDCFIHDVYQAILGGYFVTTDQYLYNASYIITGNKLHCAFGSLTGSRPVALLFCTNYRITDNECRGGGMSIETVQSSVVDTTLSSRIVMVNDCDAAISCGDNSIIDGNVMDTWYAPAGRGPQSNFFQAIECGWGGTVSNNIVRHFNIGFGYSNSNGRIVNNYFYNCGDSVAPGAYGVIFLGSYVGNSSGCTIVSGNTFVHSYMADIAVNWSGTDTLSDVTISENYSINGRERFLLATNVFGLTVINNYVRNACLSLNTTQAFGVWESDSMKSYYDGNTFINTLTGGYGMYQAIAAQNGAVINFTKVVGLRSSTPFNTNAGTQIIGSTEINGVIHGPVTPAGGGGKTLTLSNGNGWYRIAKRNPFLSGQVRIYNLTDNNINTDITAEISTSAYSNAGSDINIIKNLNYNLTHIDSIRVGYDSTSYGNFYAVLDVKLSNINNPTTVTVSGSEAITLLDTATFNSHLDSLGCKIQGNVLGWVHGGGIYSYTGYLGGTTNADSIHVKQGISAGGDVSGATFNGNSPINLTYNVVAFPASTRVAVYIPGALSTDTVPVWWQLTTDTPTHTGGYVWSFAKTDSVIFHCTTACSEQIGYMRPQD